MAPAAIVGIGAGVGALFLCAAGFILYHIILRKREHNREIAEIERGFPSATETTQVQGQGISQLPFIPTYVPYGGWNALSSSDSVCQLPPFAQVNNRIHPAFVFPHEQTRMGWAFPGMRPRIGRMPSRARRTQALSAIIESPKGASNAGSRGSPATANTMSGGQKNPPNTGEAIPTPEIPPRSASRSIKKVEVPDPGDTPVKELSRPRTTRSKSLGTVSDPSKSHNRSSSLNAPAPGPAPTGPLPPLPPLPRKISRRNHYDPSNRHSALGIPSSAQNESSTTSLSSSPDRNWERIISSANSSSIRDLNVIDQTDEISEMPTQAGAESENDLMQEDSLRSPRPPCLPGHRRSLVRLSITSNSSNRNSCSSIASSLERHVNRLSIPQIITADRVSISRVSSSGSLSSNTSGVQVVSTPRRRTGSTRVSACGSPAERPRSAALRAVSGNANSPQRPMKSSLKSSTAGPTFDWDKPLMMTPRHSILKGSPGARKGHRRQNCVRLSTLAPTVLGPRSRSTSPSLMDKITEESPETRSSGGPVAEKHMNGDVTLRPRPSANLIKLRASLTPSSPMLSLATYQQEPLAWVNGINSKRTSYSPQRPRSPLSEENALFSIPSLPSLSRVREDKNTEGAVPTPAFAFTRPSTENERTPPFGLRVTPSSSKHSLYIPETSPLPVWPRQYDTSWPLVEMDPPVTEQEYDPSRPISVYSSAEESSSPDFPFAIKNEGNTRMESPPPVFSMDVLQQNLMDDDKENDLSSARAAATELPSPFKSMPILRPHPLNIDGHDASLPEPPASPSSSICKTPPLLSRVNSGASIRIAGCGSMGLSGKRNSYSSRRRHSSPRRSNGGIEKDRKRITGPRPSPPKDVRRSVMALRRMNSDLQTNEADLGRGSRRYLRLGRQASPELDWEFEEEDEDADAGQDHPPADILVDHRASFSPSELSVEPPSAHSRECHYISYSPPKPALSLLTTLPSVARTPRAVTVWDAGEDYWTEQEKCVTEAVTASPVETPTAVLERMLKKSVNGKRETAGKDIRRKSKLLETPKSGRSMYDQEGFLKT